MEAAKNPCCLIVFGPLHSVSAGSKAARARVGASRAEIPLMELRTHDHVGRKLLAVLFDLAVFMHAYIVSQDTVPKLLSFVCHDRLTLLQILLPGTFHLAQWSTGHALSTLTSLGPRNTFGSRSICLDGCVFSPEPSYRRHDATRKAL
jgi:hypothetical protein